MSVVRNSGTWIEDNRYEYCDSGMFSATLKKMEK